MQTSFSFQKTPIMSSKPIPALAQLEQLWDEAMDLYTKGQYLESVIKVINYCDPTATAKISGNEKTFDLPHGSVNIQIIIDEQNIRISCPFLALPAEGEIALMRKATELNSGVLGLSSIVLNNNNLEFYFGAPLELCHPNKLYDILWEICVNADYYDDEFVSEFNAVRLKEPVVTPYEPALVAQVYKFYTETISECNDYINYFESKRLANYAWDSLSISLKKIDYFVQPKGYVGNMIRDVVRILGNGNIPISERISEGKKVLAQLQAITADTLANDLYHSNEFVSWKRYGKQEYIQQYFEDSYKTATSEIKNGEHMACACTIQMMFMNVFYYYRLTPEIKHFVEQTMLESSGKSWKDSAQGLYNSLNNFMENDLLTTMSDQNFDMNSYMKQAKGLMSKLSSLFS